MDVRELIARARELAALAKDATPGPWEWKSAGFGHDTLVGDNGRWPILGDGHVRGYKPGKAQIVAGLGDQNLIASAPEMADLLGKLAEELEKRLPLADECQYCGNMNEMSQFEMCANCEYGALLRR